MHPHARRRKPETLETAPAPLLHREPEEPLEAFEERAIETGAGLCVIGGLPE